MERPRWFDRRFDLGPTRSPFPDVLERLRGTPARLEERLQAVSTDRLGQRDQDRWSIQENLGHLLDLEPLWSGRLDDFLAGASELRPADLKNRRTHEAQHNTRHLEELLGAFRAARTTLVERLERLSAAQKRSSARHPRLEQPMTVADLCFFVAEHDDHHLARITEMLHQTG